MINVQGIESDMIANNLNPYKPTHPGSLLKDELEFRNISQSQFSKKLGLPNSAFNEILNGKRPITTDFALLMEAYLLIFLLACKLILTCKTQKTTRNF